MSEWKCNVCNYEGHPNKLRKAKEEWGHDYYYECPSCESEYCNDCIENRAEGEICDNCGEFTENIQKYGLNDWYCKKCIDDDNANMNKDRTFEEELESLINKFSKENLSNTPDFILDEYLNNCLTNFNSTLSKREKWYGRPIINKEEAK